jgi:adenine-specific DNA-methyltransferase
MANELQELLNEIRDPRLKERLSAAVNELRKNKKFGLVFEEHIPELLPIYGAKIRSGSRVARKDGKLLETFSVERVANGFAAVKPEQGEGATQEIAVEHLVVVKRFGEAIFPMLRRVDAVLRGGDAPHHAIVEADNYHALQLLAWLYPAKVDCIYIDPPYNTGARDWKYNNDYVDANDSWRHSKWLSMMQRRLRLAKSLLNPRDSVLIVTIDEKEYSRLALLLEEIFPEARIQIVSTMINPANVARVGAFGRSDEYIFFVMMGGAAPERLRLPREWVSSKGRTHTGNVRWDLLRRSGTNAARSHAPGCFYPIYVDPDSVRVEFVGEALPKGQSVPKPRAHLVPVLPIRKDRSEGNWQWSPETFRSRMAEGRVRVGGSKKRGFVIYILKDGEFAKIQRGEFEVLGRNADGSLLVESTDTEFVLAIPGNQWRASLHDATQYGSRLLAKLLPDRKFPFPKSLYAVRDAIRFFVESKPNALVVDFFAGSGTTLHAVDLLNVSDGGRRRCILVTNNEVSAEEAARLRANGILEDSMDWRRHGICQSVTYPRCKVAIDGKREDGVELDGEYMTGQIAQQELPRTFRSLNFTAPEFLASMAARESLAVTLGFSKSDAIGGEPYFLAEGERVSALLEASGLDAFVARGAEFAESIDTVYLPFPAGKAFNEARELVLESWPPITKMTEVRRPMGDGLPSNLDYFRLEFLDRSQAEVGGKLSDILPALWMMAGCRGKLPAVKGGEKTLFFKDCPFAVLVDESAIQPFLANLARRPDISWVFVVTHDQDNFSRICEWLPQHVPPSQRVHLWRNYVDNFLINVDRGSTGTA